MSYTEEQQIRQAVYLATLDANKEAEQLCAELQTARNETSSFAVKMAHEIDSRECKITELTNLARDLRDALKSALKCKDSRILIDTAEDMEAAIKEADLILGEKK